jgi:threonyl-tRNA synthetase
MSLDLNLARHSLAHVMAAAVQELFPEAQFGVGPVIENGMYYDFVLPRTIIPEDLDLIETKMRTILKRNLAIKREEVTLDHAVELFSRTNQPLKVELLKDLATKGTTRLDETDLEIAEVSGTTPVITLYRIVDTDTGEVLFEDLCRGPHIEDCRVLRNIGFKLDKFSGVYWRGDEERGIKMQRVYALVMETPDELKKFVVQREEAKKRDHRLLNETGKYFTISDAVGAGLPMLQPRGALLKKLLTDYLWQLHKPRGYQQVWTPHITKQSLYETSGHMAHYGPNLFKVTGSDSKEQFVMKPMNCPHHMQIFKDNQFSYRDMPIRYFEPATVYRDEKSGQLSGLTRVRSITQDDGHLFVRTSQIAEEVDIMISIIRDFYGAVGMEVDTCWVSLSVRDMSKKSDYMGTEEFWDIAESALENSAKQNNLNYKKVEGEAAFYGPKLDFMFKDSIGREWQLSTIQLDLNLPEKFDLSFINEEGKKERPVVLHRAISGSLERFMGVYLEHTAGWLPLWLAPEQVRILTVNNEQSTLDYVKMVTTILDGIVLSKPLKHNEIRYTVDHSDEGLGKKIKQAKIIKIPLVIIVGPKDIEAGEVTVNTHGEEKKIEIGALRNFVEGL